MTRGSIDITANRNAVKWSKRELLGRLLWDASWILFRLSPRQFWVWRRILLRLFGAKIGKNVHIYPSVKIAIPWNLRIDDYAAIGDAAILYSLGPIAIGSQACISQYAHLCAGSHDYHSPAMTLVKSNIEIGPGAWVCANAFIGPDTNIGEFAIVGAASVATKDVPARTIVAGNPMKTIGRRQIFTAK